MNPAISARLMIAATLLTVSAALVGQEDPWAKAPTVTAKDSKRGTQHRLSSSDLVDGTSVYLELPSALSSAREKAGEKVELIVVEELRVNGLLVVAAGARAWATVTDARGRGRFLKDGRLDLRIDDVELVDGERIPLRMLEQARGRHSGDTGTMLAISAGDPIDAAWAWPASAFVHGDEVEIPGGTRIIAYVHGDHGLDEKRLDLPLVTIHAVPEIADVEIDGAPAGRSPVTRVLYTGDHAIKISAAGYKSWERTLTVIGGKVSVNAELLPMAKP